MFGKRCSLCGGKLVNNKCTLCGLDNSKSDANYKVNVSQCDKEPLTHVHDEPEKYSVRTGENEKRKQKNHEKKPNTPVTDVKIPTMKSVLGTEGKKKKSKKGWIVAIIMIALMGAEGIKDMAYDFTDNFEEWTDQDEYEPETPVDYDESQYEYVTRELAETGEVFEEDIQPGKYIVGVHIPEGTYKVSKIGEENYPYMILDDPENAIYISASFNEDVQEVEDLRCYTGAVIEVNDGEALHFYSENAQTEAMESLKNPLTEAADVKDGYIAGVDFPVGTYDIVEPQGSNTGTQFSYVVPGTIVEDAEDEDYLSVTDSIWIEANEQEYVYKNLYFPEGTKMIIQEDKVIHLKSSDVIPQSYEGYYYIFE